MISRTTQLVILPLMALGAIVLVAQFGSLTTTAQQPRVWKPQVLPITDENPPLPDDPRERQLRQLRGKRHDLTDKSVDPQIFRLTEKSPKVLVSLPAPNAKRDAAFPVGASTLVAIGVVEKSRAYQSNDKTALYSEFTVLIQHVLKGGNSLNFAAPIIVQRSGGRLRLSSGEELVRATYGRGMPDVGSRYLLFLSEDRDAESFSLLTGYELTGGKVLPLDRTPDGEKSSRQFSEYEKYTGVDESFLLAQVQLAIAQSRIHQ
jgi:hypothetical protein